PLTALLKGNVSPMLDASTLSNSCILIIIVAGIAVLHYNMCVCASILHRSEERLGGILFEKEQL
ncbi:MAG: hypothetical protein ACI4NQ_01760, partial [Christensenellales bacterium]